MSRPRGSKTREYTVAEEIPASCPRCGSTELTVIKGCAPVIQPYHGPMTYDRIVIRRKQCKCGQHLAVKSYQKRTNAVSKQP